MEKLQLQKKCDEMAERVMVELLWSGDSVKGLDGNIFYFSTRLGSEWWSNLGIEGDQMDSIRDSISSILFKYYTGQTPDLYTDGVVNLLEAK